LKGSREAGLFLYEQPSVPEIHLVVRDGLAILVGKPPDSTGLSALMGG
jgi:hypothetical protein